MSYSCDCDYDPPTFYFKRRVRAARSNHRCEECGRTIYAGESYEYVVGYWGDIFGAFHTCDDCAALRDWAVSAVPCFCWAHGSLRDDIKDMVEYYSHEIPGFFVEYGRLVIKARRRRKDLDRAAVLR